MIIAFLHLAPIAGDVAGNRRLIETAVGAAAGAGAAWILTPEFCISGFTFEDRIGTDWIREQPDPWMAGFCRRVGALQVTVFLAAPGNRGVSAHRLVTRGRTPCSPSP